MKNIFDDEERRKEFYSDFDKQFASGVLGSKKDRYFYYALKADFSYKGGVSKLLSYDVDNKTAKIDFNGKEISVGFEEIKRIV